MKRLLTIFQITALCLSLCPTLLWAANTKKEVQQVTTSITIDDNTDYVITGDTPFGDEGLADITGLEHGVLILQSVKPSVAINEVLPTKVLINGARAQDGVNCQVRIYGTRGSMILPYDKNAKPLTTYTGQNFEGESCNNYNLGNDGGYMQTLTDKQLNNRIRSFKLKRGYMVTFATQKSGYGYQRCFIANDADVEFATLPQILDGKISSYRIFRWNTVGKKGLASSTNSHLCDTLNVISCYDWGVGHDMLPDVECVANHLYEDYPSSKACGAATWTCHMKTNNEPRNSSDDKPQTLETILANWQNLMRTGMRLCSPSSWDGSDYTDGSGFLNSFFQAIDARGWRCDIADLHCYWLVDVFDKLGTMQAKYKRPIWISEWIWGASWNKNGAFESGKTDWDNEWAVKTICGKLNGMDYVERYYYWNSESKGKLNSGNDLTPAGKWYASQLTGMGYKPKYEKVPNTPPMKGGFTNFQVTEGNGQAVISWHDYDGEYNQLMELLRKEPGQPWATWKTISPEDAEADYQVTDDNYSEGTRYRLHIRSFSGRDYYSSEDMEPGEAIAMTDGTLRYVGGNIVHNGNFAMGFSGWTAGDGQPLQQPWFQVLPSGITGGQCLQAYGDKGKDDVASLKTVFDIEPGQDYILRVASQNAGNYMKIDVRKKGETGDANKGMIPNTAFWKTQQVVFNSDKGNEAMLAFRWLAATAQLGEIELRRLFTTPEEAIQDGIEQARKRAQTIMQFNTKLPALNTELQNKLTTLSQDNLTNSQLLTAIQQAGTDLLDALALLPAIDSLLSVAQTIGYMEFDGREELQQAVAKTADMATVAAIKDCKWQLEQALAHFLTMTEAAQQPASPTLSSADGWTTKAGTFTGGDQETTTKEEKTCWNAWWSGLSASEGTGKTMEINQRIGGLPEGLYSLECKATTEHYCLTDQHGFIATESEEATTPPLTRDYLDVPGTPSAWQTLTTTPIYVAEGDTLTIGFKGSKQGAVDGAWRRYGFTNEEEESNNTKSKGDQREGWWCATDFRLLYHPIFRRPAEPGKWGTVCLPYTYRIPTGMKLYSIAGLLSDYAHICLQEVTQPEAGRPYIYATEKDTITYYTYGEAEQYPKNTDNNDLRGFFLSTATVTMGVYVLQDGVWQRTTKREKPADYTAIISRTRNMPLIDTWDGPTMPINGVADEMAAGIDATATSGDTNASLYSVGGMHIDQPKGVYIQKKGQLSKKMLAK